MGQTDSPSAKPPKAAIFDIGGVIVRVSVDRTTGMAAGLGRSPKELWRTIESDPRFCDWQEGKIDPREWHRYVTQKLGSSLDFEAFCASWNRVLDPEPIIGDEVLRELGSRCRLGLLSNTDPIHVAYMERNFSFMRHFPVRVYSCGAGVRKPNPQIYRRALAELGVAAGEAMYFDDLPENVAAAREIGMLGVRFTGLAALETELRRHGLLAASPA
jgi:glucose-1-phosphatase